LPDLDELSTASGKFVRLCSMLLPHSMAWKKPLDGVIVFSI
jgi:hypothetical protein